MAELGTRTLTVVKGSYLIGFFALISGVFYPIITQTPFTNVITGVLVLFVGLFGGFLIYRGAVSEKSIKPLVIAGLAILFVALVLMFAVAGAF